MSHSKRNTSLAFFTSYERSLLKHSWGSQKSRLSRDSFLPFGSCALCLLTSRDPVACLKGDIFCRECAMSNLLSQRQEIKRLEREMEKAKNEERDQEERDDEAARERAVREFELVQMGLNARSGAGARIVGREGGKIVVEEEDGGKEKKGVKRKFELDEDELLRIAKEERTKYKKELDAEKKASYQRLPSFWVPSQTPDSTTSTTATHTIVKPPKLVPLCPSSSEEAPHPISLKSLTSIRFTEEPDPTTNALVRSCPACRKALNNSSKAVVAIPCGHVLCKPCVSKFMTPVSAPDPHNPDLEHNVLRCYVCEADLTDGGKEKGKKSKKDGESAKPGLVDLRSEGTGFAGGGGNLVKKDGVAFQC